VKIKDIPYPKVKQAAIENCGDENYLLHAAFIWHQSKEGLKFWFAIDEQDYEKAEKLCPDLFEENKDA